MLTPPSVHVETLSPHVHRLDDGLCAAYAITRGDRALLVDLGSGAALDALPGLGVRSVDWLLLTHHHRDQCHGVERLDPRTRVAAPARELHLLADAETFWRTRIVYDRYDGSSVDNSPARNVRVDRPLADYAELEWEGLRIAAFPTPGHTRGSLTYLVSADGTAYAFSGDLVHSPGRALTLHDLEWWYGFAEGARVAAQSAHALRGRRPARLCPSHGAVMEDPEAALAQLEANLERYVAAADQGYRTRLGPDPLLPAGEFVRLSEHLVAATGACANFYVLHDDDGNSLFFDFGFPSEQHCAAGFRFVEHSLPELADRFGVRPPEVLVATHYHDDHVAGASFLNARHGTEIWASERFADVLERPFAYRLPCVWGQPVRVARRLREAEPFAWRGFRFDVHHCPGHTWYASALVGDVDGRRVAATGDELVFAPSGRLWGNVPVFRNRLGPADYSRTSELLLACEPDLLLTGHKGALPVTRADLESFRDWAHAVESSWHALAACPDEIGFALDPDVISVDPYQATAAPGGSVSLAVQVRNHHAHPAEAELALVPPPGWTAEPARAELALRSGECGRAAFALRPPPTALRGVRHVVLVDAVLGERRLGHAAECLVTLG